VTGTRVTGTAVIGTALTGTAAAGTTLTGVTVADDVTGGAGDPQCGRAISTMSSTAATPRTTRGMFERDLPGP
jgi:hypothetical protein